MNTHEHLSIEILADYAEGLLGDADATSVAEHLASCADCQEEADLLVSVSSILAADDPGPMPAHYAARIDAALAELAAAEPVTPKPATAVAGGAAVIDLASRRRFTPAARVTSVAASLVLLIGGVALGMQALDTSNSGNPDDSVASELRNEAVSLPAIERAALYAQKDFPAPQARKKGKNGAIIDKTDGTVFIKNKVLFPDGTVVVHKKSGIAEVRTFNAETNTYRVEQVPSPRRGAPAPNPTPAPPVRTPAGTPEGTPAPPVRTPAPTPTPSPSPTPEPQPTPSAAPVTAPSPNPWVENSGDAYTPDNFANKVQALLRNSGDTVKAPAAPPADGTTDQNRVSAGALRSQEAAVKARGPAPAEIAAKVKRCANQLGLTDVLAGDAGTWRGQSATIIATRLGSAQATGYVVYGDCTKEAPATPADIQWEQRVDLPTTRPVEEPTPRPTSPAATSNTVTPSVSGAATNSASSSQEQ